MISIDEVMTRELHTLKPDDSLARARTLMAEKRIRHIPIVNDEQELLGLLTQRDLLAAADSILSGESAQTRDDREGSTPVSRVMTTQLISVDENASLRGAALHLQQHKHGCLPVIRDGRLNGIITDSDFVAVAINLLEQLEAADPTEGEAPELDL